jgi:hypothetical protein
MKKAILVVLGLAMLLPMAAMAQTTATLQVSATVQSAIYLTLENVTGGATLGNPSTNAATMNLGTVSAFGTYSVTNVARTLNGPATAPTAIVLTTAFGVKVAQFNAGTSTGYSLNANLSTADSVNTWSVDGKTLTTTSQAITGGTAAQYNTAVSHPFILTIPVSVAAGSVGNTINLTAAQL